MFRFKAFCALCIGLAAAVRLSSRNHRSMNLDDAQFERGSASARPSQRTDQTVGSQADENNLQTSVVLACADEGFFAVKTALKVFERTPSEKLREIIVVDDGSQTSMEETFTNVGIDEDMRKRKKIRIVRNEQSLGLTLAKQAGADTAEGDVIVFFDCHVSPQPQWYDEISKLISQNPRRMVVPSVTDLDLVTWDEKKDSDVNTKFYATLDGDFKPFASDSPEVPIMGDGPVAISRFWWNATGGYDKAMAKGGAENMEQSLRSWLCGGEIVQAKTSRVAHMVRDGDAGGETSSKVNRDHVVTSWFDVFRKKNFDPDTAELKRLKENLACKPIVHFLHRFRDIYVDGGVIAPKIFQLKERTTGLCLQLDGGDMQMGKCLEGATSPAGNNWFHWANHKSGSNSSPGSNSGKCCSGIRVWGGSDCAEYSNGKLQSKVCDLTGKSANQQFTFLPSGNIAHRDGRCLGIVGQATVGLVDCGKTQSTWKEETPLVPPEAKLYAEQLAHEELTDPIFYPTLPYKASRDPALKPFQNPYNQGTLVRKIYLKKGLGAVPTGTDVVGPF
eukprot:gnl/TRDRNA2_/TRDRNA2_183578_c0_seq1.p1 gnl/TRDRNA2_/TRDRNA2_183578_c0~~gnl/TRDRNA2_/TRDRNA2_183578_c0_seq1.p1  ORF type:complete len:559 (+),score=117.19 gnl/TRDRNA2_/TRDRNA2_183578_c0_seq1:57-1733(+)